MAAYRAIAVVAGLATLLVIADTVRRVWPARMAFAIVAFGANPVVLFHAVSSGHNDLVVALAVATTFALLVRGRELPAIAVLALGALVKATLLVPLILVVVWIVARRAPGERLRAGLKATGVAAVIGLAFALPYLQPEDPSLGMLELAKHEGWLAPATLARRVVDMVSFGTLGGLAKLVFAAALVAALIAVGRMVAREAVDPRPRTPGAAIGVVARTADAARSAPVALVRDVGAPARVAPAAGAARGDLRLGRRPGDGAVDDRAAPVSRRRSA